MDQKTGSCCFVDFASVAATDPVTELYRTFKYVSVFRAEGMAITVNLEIKKQSRQGLSIF
jgi:hypothetical protein